MSNKHGGGYHRYSGHGRIYIDLDSDAGTDRPAAGMPAYGDGLIKIVGIAILFIVFMFYTNDCMVGLFLAIAILCAVRFPVIGVPLLLGSLFGEKINLLTILMCVVFVFIGVMLTMCGSGGKRGGKT